ncbi:MAG: hypothetical protein WCX82_03465 [archaeon]|jgi:hypothetical protein
MKRKTTITMSIRSKMNRSGNATCDICKTKTILITHHLNGRRVEHYNQSNNISSICGTCHDKVHTGEIVIEGWIDTTMGRIRRLNRIKLVIE